MASATSPDLRYPIGQFAWTERELTAAERNGYIDVLERTPEELRAAVSGLSAEQIETPYRPGGWTIRQLVHHCADSHMNSYIRFKLALTEDQPTIKPYEEKLWAETPDNDTPVETSLALFAALHDRWVRLLRSLTPEQWQRRFVHPVSGVNSLDRTVALYAWHSRHHVAHITTLRERMGW